MFCKNCGKELDSKAVICTNCGCAIKAKKSKKKALIIVGIFFLVMFIAVVSSGGESTGGGDNTTAAGDLPASVTETTVPEEFSGKCPIEFSANVDENIIGVPELTCRIENKTKKEIAAIQFYFMPKDVYGEEVNTFMTSNKLYTDETISAQSSVTRTWQLLEQSVKSGDLYVYSVYFADGSEWGDKQAFLSDIKKYGVKITVEE